VPEVGAWLGFDSAQSPRETAVLDAVRHLVQFHLFERNQGESERKSFQSRIDALGRVF
jgi:hypothetical protein